MDTNSLQGSPFRSLAFASIACLMGVSQAPATQSALAAPSVTVSYHDLNLSTVEGASTLYKRIRRAANSVCGYEGRTLYEQRLWKACFDDAIAHAVATIDNPLLTGVHGRAGHSSS
jgi:UrcA family protein